MRAWLRYREMRAEAELTEALGLERDPVRLGDLSAEFVDWAQDFLRIDKRLEAEANSHG